MKRITRSSTTQQAQTTFFETITSSSVTPKTSALTPICLSIMVTRGSEVRRVVAGERDALWQDLCSTAENQRVFLMTRPIYESLQEVYDHVKPIPSTSILELNATREDALAAIREGRFSEIIIRAEKLIDIPKMRYFPDKVEFTLGKAANLPAPILTEADSEAPPSSSDQPQEEDNQLQPKTITLAKGGLSSCSFL